MWRNGSGNSKFESCYVGIIYFYKGFLICVLQTKLAIQIDLGTPANKRLKRDIFFCPTAFYTINNLVLHSKKELLFKDSICIFNNRNIRKLI